MATKMKKYGNGGWEKTTPGHVTPKMSSGGSRDGDKPKKGLLKRLFGRKTDEEKKQELINNRGSKPEINYTNPYSKPEGKKGMVVKTKMKIGGMANKIKEKYGEGGPTTKAQSTPTEQSSQPNTPPVGTNKLTGNPRLKNGGTKTTYKTGGMVNANAKLVATKSAGSKGVKVKVNPKATASNTAKKPSKPRSKAPKKALPKAAYGMSVKGYNMGGGTGDGTQVPYGTQTFKEVTVAAPKKSKGKPKAKYGMAMKGKKSC